MQEAIEVKQFVAEGKDPGEIWTEACVAAKLAVEDFVSRHGEPLYCGFANVKVRPAVSSPASTFSFASIKLEAIPTPPSVVSERETVKLPSDTLVVVSAPASVLFPTKPVW